MATSPAPTFDIGISRRSHGSLIKKIEAGDTHIYNGLTYTVVKVTHLNPWERTLTLRKPDNRR